MDQKPGLQKEVSSIFDDDQFAKIVSEASAAVKESEQQARGDDSPGSALQTQTPQVQTKSPDSGSKADSVSQKAHDPQAGFGPKSAKTFRDAKFYIALKKFAPAIWGKLNNYSILLVTTVLSFALLAMAIKLMGLFSHGNLATASQADIENISEQTYQARVYWQIPGEIPEDFRDVTQSGNATHHGEKLIIKGIVYGGATASAIIGKGIVHVGDNVMGAEVIDIGLGYVEFEMNGKKWRQSVEH